MDNFSSDLLASSGFDTPEKLVLRKVVLAAIRDSDELWQRCWKHTDAYGEVGTIPPQGYDWSGFRDSSYPAIVAMADEIKKTERRRRR